MDFNLFLEALDKKKVGTAKNLFEGGGSGEGLAGITTKAYKDAIESMNVGTVAWSYEPKEKALVVLEHSPDSWSIYTFAGVTESKKSPGRMIFEADDEETENDELAHLGRVSGKVKRAKADVAAPGAGGLAPKSGTVADAIHEKVSFEIALKECVEIVEKNAYSKSK